MASVGLTFNAKNHQYRLDGMRVPGVTTIIGKTVPKPQLVNWAARTVAEFVAENEYRITELRADGPTVLIAYLKALADNKRDTAAVRGTDVHADAAALLAGHPEDALRLPHAQDYVLSYEEFLAGWNPTPVLIEFACANRRHWYAGTGDAVMDIPTETLDQLPAQAADAIGTRPLVDLKTSRGVYPEVAYQTAAYAHAEFYLDEDGEEQSMAELGITGAMCVHITPTGTDVTPLDAGAETFSDFTHMAHLARRFDRSKSLLYPQTPTLRRTA